MKTKWAAEIQPLDFKLKNKMYCLIESTLYGGFHTIALF